MYIPDESLRNITIRKNKRNFRLSNEDNRIVHDTETVSPSFPLEVYNRIPPPPDLIETHPDQPLINDYDELNEILSREWEQRSFVNSSSPQKFEENISKKNKEASKSTCIPIISSTHSHETIACTSSEQEHNNDSSAETYIETIQNKEDNDNDKNTEILTSSSDSTYRTFSNITHRTKSNIINDTNKINNSSDDSFKTNIANITHRNKTLKKINYNDNFCSISKFKSYKKSMLDIFSSEIEETVKDSEKHDKVEANNDNIIESDTDLNVLNTKSKNNKTKNTKAKKNNKKNFNETRKIENFKNNINIYTVSIDNISCNKTNYNLRSRIQSNNNTKEPHDGSTETLSNNDTSSDSNNNLGNINEKKSNDENNINESLKKNEIEYLGIIKNNDIQTQSNIFIKRNTKTPIKNNDQPIVLLDRIDNEINNSNDKSTDNISKESDIVIHKINQIEDDSSEQQTDFVCKSCKKKTPIKNNRISHEHDDEKEDDDFVDNVCDMSGVEKLLRSVDKNLDKNNQYRKKHETVKLMRGVIAYVDIKLDGSDKSRGIIKILKSMGAQISKSLDRNVTHVVFYEGAISTVEKAKKLNVPLVSVSWVSACKESGLLLSADTHPPVHIDNYVANIKQNKDGMFKTVLRTLSKDLDELAASNLNIEDMEVPLSIMVLRKYISPYEEDSEHIYDLKSIELSLELNQKKRHILRKLLFPDKSIPDSEPSDNSFSPVQLTPRCSAPARLFSKDRSKRKKNNFKMEQFGEEISKIKNILNTEQKEERVTRSQKNNYDNDDCTQRREPTISLKDKIEEIHKKNIESKTTLDKKIIPSRVKKNRIQFRRSSLPNKNKTPVRPPSLCLSSKKCDSTDWKMTTTDISSKQSTLKSCLSNPSTSSSSYNKRRLRTRRKRLYEDDSQEKIEDTTTFCTKNCPIKTPHMNCNPNNKPMNELLQPIRKLRTNSSRKRNNINKSEKKKSDKLKMNDKRYHNIYESADKKNDKMINDNRVIDKMLNVDKRYSDIYESNTDAVAIGGEGDTSHSSSSYWFVSDSLRSKNNKNTMTHNTQQNSNIKKAGIVCTGISSKDIKVIYSYVTELGHFIIEPKVTSRTTHVIVDGPKRTLNLLKGIARGCWVLKSDWVYASFNVGRWLYEQRFELTSFSPAVKRCRMEKQTFGNLYSLDVLSKYGKIYVSRNSKPPKEDLRELVSLAGGQITSNAQEADIVLGESPIGKQNLKEVWLLDCITKCSQLSFQKYIL